MNIKKHVLFAVLVSVAGCAYGMDSPESGLSQGLIRMQRQLEKEKQNSLQALSKFLDPESFSAIEKQILQEDSSEKERKSFSTTQTTVHDLQQLQAWVKEQKDVTAEYETRTLDFFRELGQKGSDAMLRNSP